MSHSEKKSVTEDLEPDRDVVGVPATIDNFNQKWNKEGQPFLVMKLTVSTEYMGQAFNLMGRVSKHRSVGLFAMSPDVQEFIEGASNGEMILPQEPEDCTICQGKGTGEPGEVCQACGTYTPEEEESPVPAQQEEPAPGPNGRLDSFGGDE